MAEQGPMGYAVPPTKSAGVGFGREITHRPNRPASVGFVKLSTGDYDRSFAQLASVSQQLSHDRHERILRAQAELLGMLEESDSNNSRSYRLLRPALYESSEVGNVVWRVWWDDPTTGVQVAELSYDPRTHKYESEIGGMIQASYERLPFLRNLEAKLQASASHLPPQNSSLDQVVD